MVPLSLCEVTASTRLTSICVYPFQWNLPVSVLRGCSLLLLCETLLYAARAVTNHTKVRLPTAESVDLLHDA